MKPSAPTAHELVSQRGRPYRAAIFDLDGVLIDSVGAHRRAWARTFTDLGVAMSEAEIDAVLGWRNEDLIPRLLAITEPNELRRIADRKEATYRAELGTSVPTIPGVETFLATLDRQGILLAVATSAPKANVDHAMARLSFAALFVSVARGDQVVRGKPAPDLCLCALRGIAASAADTILFEDTPAGIEGGKRAGLTVVALTTTHSSSHLGAADLIVEDFRDPRLRDLF